MVHKIPKFRLEVCFVFILIVLGVLIMIASLRYGFGTPEQPGTGLYPFFVGLSILLTSMISCFLVLRSPASEPLFSDKYEIKTFSLMVLTFILWIITMPYLGYVLVTLAGNYSFCKVMKLEGWKKPLALSVVTALLIYLVFDWWLYIDLPRGILE